MAGDFGTAALVALSEGRKRSVAHSRLQLTLPQQTAHKTHRDGSGCRRVPATLCRTVAGTRHFGDGFPV